MKKLLLLLLVVSLTYTVNAQIQTPAPSPAAKIEQVVGLTDVSVEYYLALKGLERMMHTVNMIERGLHHRLSYNIVATMYDCRTRASRSVLAALKERYRADLLSSVIPVDTLFREASSQGVPLPHWQPASRGAHSYAGAVDELLGIELDQLETMLT